MPGDICAVPVGGDFNKPCVRRAGHKDRYHRDATYYERATGRRRSNPDFLQREAARQANYARDIPEDGTCGWHIKGDITRPCAKRYEHKGAHRDANSLERSWRAQAKARNPSDTSRYYKTWSQSPNGQLSVKYRSDKRRAIKANAITGPLPNNLTEYLGSLYGWECQACFCKLDEKSATVDHVIPLNSALPMHVLFNLAILCKSCNSSKRDRLGGWLSEEEIILLMKLKEC